MASIASQVLQIVPAAGKTDVPSVSSPRDEDNDFLNHLASAMERRDDALDNAALRAETRDAANTKAAARANEDTPRRGEAISEAAPNHEKRKDSAALDSVDSSDRGPIADRDDVTTDSADAKRQPAQGEGERQPSETADTATNTKTGEPASPTTAATDNGEHPPKAAPQVAEAVVPTAPGESVVAATVLPSETDGAPAAPLAADAPADQPIPISTLIPTPVPVAGDAGKFIDTGAAPVVVSAAPVAGSTGQKPGNEIASNATAQPDQAVKPAAQPDLPANPAAQPGLEAKPTAQPDANAKTDTPPELAAVPTQGDQLASAASGAMADTGKTKGKPQEKAAQASQTDGPKVVLTPKTGGEIKRPTDSGNVHVAPADGGDTAEAGSASKSKGFSPTTVPGNRQPGGQTTQTPQTSGLQNALASVSDTQGGESNGAPKLASLVDSAPQSSNSNAGAPAPTSAAANLGANPAAAAPTSPSANTDAGAPKAAPTPSTAAPQPQAPTAGVANLQALQTASAQAAPLRAAAAAPPTPAPNPASFQVAVHVARAINDGLDQIKIRLHPANLGRVEVKLELAPDGRVSATVIADKSDTLDMLQRDSRALERALQDAGLRTDSESLSFGLRGEQDDEAGKSGEGDEQADGQNDDGLEDDDPYGVIPPSRPLLAQAGALDIFV